MPAGLRLSARRPIVAGNARRALADPAAARAFLARHSARIAPRVLREVGNKLRTGRKNP